MNKKISAKRIIIAALTVALVAAAGGLCIFVASSCGRVDDKRYKTAVVSHEVIGCGGYGSVFEAKIDPFDGNNFAALCDMGGIYFSYDKGESWIRHNVKGTLYALEYDEANNGVVWFAGSGVYKSTDHGRTIEAVFPKQSEITSEGNNYENFNYWIYTDEKSDYAPQYQIRSIAINRKSSGKEVYCAQRVPDSGMGYNKCVRVYRTTDGENFGLFAELPYSFNFKIEYDESNDRLVYVTPDGISEIDKNGKTVGVVDQPVTLQFANGNKLSFDSYYDASSGKNTFVFSAPVNDEHVKSACYKTNDILDKSSYLNITDELADLSVNDLGLDEIAAYNRDLKSYEYCEWIDGKTVKQRFEWAITDVYAFDDDIVYLFHEASTPTYKSDGTFYLNRRTSVYLKYDAKKPAGKRFSWVYGFPLKQYSTAITNASWQDGDMRYCFGMCSIPQNDNALLFCNNVGLYFTENGRTVKQLNSKIFGSDELNLTDGANTQVKSLRRVTTAGVDVVCTQTAVTDPFDEDHVLMGCTDIGILQSYDGAKSWYRGLYEWRDGVLSDIKYADYTNTCYDIVFDKERRGVVYALWSAVQNAPYAAAENYLTSQGRFGISYDGGLSWIMKNITTDGRCLPYRMQMVYEGDRRIIYIADDGRGFFVSHDLGETFVSMNDGIEPCIVGDKTAIWGNEIISCDLGIFAVTGGIAHYEDAGHGFYKWNETAKKFEKTDLPASIVDSKEFFPSAIRDIEYDPLNDCLYLACITNNVTNYKSMKKTAGGILKYKNGVFSQIYDDSVSVFSLNLDGAGRLYAAELNGAIARFDNDNTTCEVLIDGLFHSLKKIYFGADDDILYVATWGGNTEKIVLGKVPQN